MHRVPSARIEGLVSCVPSRIIDNRLEAERLGYPNPKRLIEAIGVLQRRIAAEQALLSDLLEPAAELLLERLHWPRSSVAGLVLVTQSPDRQVPATAFHMHRRLGLSEQCFAFDVNLGCSAYPYGLWIAQSLMNPRTARRVLLLVGDLSSRYLDPADTGTSFLFGDAATATALEWQDSPDPTRGEDLFMAGTDGTGELAIHIDRFQPVTKAHDQQEALYTSPTLFMNGSEVTAFALREVPRLVAQLRANSHLLSGDHRQHDVYLLHQANGYLLEHLRRKLKLEPQAMPHNIEHYGNTASASIPLLMTTRLAPLLCERELKVAMIGFGTGLSWSGISRTIGPMKVLETLQIDA